MALVFLRCLRGDETGLDFREKAGRSNKCVFLKEEGKPRAEDVFWRKLFEHTCFAYFKDLKDTARRVSSSRSERFVCLLPF